MDESINEKIGQWKQIFGGQITNEEASFLRSMQELFAQTLQKRKGFNSAVFIAVTKLQGFIRSGASSQDRTRLALFFLEEAFKRGISLPSDENLEITKREEALCRDIIAAIDFVIRNGLGFGFIAEGLCHDLSEIITHKSFDEAVFCPRLDGFASPEIIGDIDE